MLRQLRIKNFAIIDDLTIGFESGFTVITGETGAGKSIIIDALGLTLGERTQADMIRTGKSEAVAEAFFESSSVDLPETFGIPLEEGLILRRSLQISGKSRAYINDSMVNAQTLFEVGRTLVDMHGQHEHQSLLSVDNQRAVLDAYGKLAGEKSRVGELFKKRESAMAELAGLKTSIKEKAQRVDYLSFQVKEIDAVSMQAGEKETLTEEKAILANLSRLNELTDSSYELLYSGDGSLSEKLSTVLSELSEVARIDSAIKEALTLLREAGLLIEDAVVSLRNHKDKYDMDPKRLEVVDDRLDSLKKLERKYGTDIEGILEYRDAAVRELETLTLSDERIRELEAALAATEDTLTRAAAGLSARRKEVALRIEKDVNSVLKELAMEKAELRISFKPIPPSSSGIDQIEFLLSANQGETPKSLTRIASGGELSRIMLALKGILAEADKIPLLIFDEVDAGIGGKTAESVGNRLKNLAKRHQILCITHLPQIAAMADHHIMIEKSQKQDSVYVKVKELSSEEREQEIARMLSGKITDISLSHARELLGDKR